MLKQYGNTRSTYMSDDNGQVTQWYLYETPIITLEVNTNGTFLTLDNGGYETPTTKKRMNQLLSDMDINAYVYQKNGDWRVAYGDSDIAFGNDCKAHLVIKLNKTGQTF